MGQSFQGTQDCRFKELSITREFYTYVCVCMYIQEEGTRAGQGVSVETFRLGFRNDRRAGLPGNNICTACT